MAELGSLKPRHTLLLCHDHRCPKNTVQAILDAARPLFTDVRDLEAKADIDGWPEGANYMFRTVNSYLSNNATNVKSFLWLEPDAIPLKPNWLDAIDDEFGKCGKPFMGDDVQVNDIPRHMSGVGVYPNPIYNFAGEANRAAGVAWDMASAHQIVPQAHFTKLIEHAWRHETFTNRHELTTQIRPEAVIFHSSKDGSLIKLLRNEKNVHQVPAGTTYRAIQTQAGVSVLETMPNMREQNQSGMETTHEKLAQESKMGSAQTSTKNSGGGASVWQNTKTGELRTLRDSDFASRSPSELQRAAKSDVVVPEVPSDGTQSLEMQRSQAQAGPTGLEGVVVHPPGVPGSSNEGENPSPLHPASFPPCDQLHSLQHKGPIDAGKYFKKSGPVYDIFIRTYPEDYKWLKFCLQSINKYASGFRKIWIVSPEDVPFADTQGYEWKQMNDECEDGYLSQQIHKLYADNITNYEANYILHIDSDTLFTRPVTPQDFFSAGDMGEPLGTNSKLIWYYTPYEHTQTPWKVITQKFLGEDPPFEFMRRLPMMIPTWLYPKLRQFCFDKHKVTLGDYVKAQTYREFSEFNALGAYAWFFEHDKFHWVNTMEGEMPPPFARQFWSYGGINDEVKAEIQMILSGETQVRQADKVMPCVASGEQVPPQATMGNPAQTSSGAVEVKAAAPPFPNGDDETPGDHVRWLEKYIEGSPSRRQYVMTQLKKARLVPLKRGKVKR